MPSFHVLSASGLKPPGRIKVPPTHRRIMARSSYSVFEAQTDHINTSILQDMISGIPLVSLGIRMSDPCVDVVFWAPHVFVFFAQFSAP